MRQLLKVILVGGIASSGWGMIITSAAGGTVSTEKVKEPEPPPKPPTDHGFFGKNPHETDSVEGHGPGALPGE